MTDGAYELQAGGRVIRLDSSTLVSGGTSLRVLCGVAGSATLRRAGCAAAAEHRRSGGIRQTARYGHTDRRPMTGLLTHDTDEAEPYTWPIVSYKVL